MVDVTKAQINLVHVTSSAFARSLYAFSVVTAKSRTKFPRNFLWGPEFTA